MLIDDGFSMNFRFNNFKSVKNNLISLNYKLAFLHEHNDVRVHGLLGMDVIQFIKNIKMVDCMKSSAWEFPVGISPSGNLSTFFVYELNYPYKSSGKAFQTQLSCHSV